MAHRTTIKHDYLCVEFCEDGSVQIVHEGNGGSIRLSISEWNYLTAVFQIHDWPIVPHDAALRPGETP